MNRNSETPSEWLNKGSDDPVTGLEAGHVYQMTEVDCPKKCAEARKNALEEAATIVRTTRRREVPPVDCHTDNPPGAYGFGFEMGANSMSEDIYKAILAAIARTD
jgi:hypothetical protein